MRARAEALIVSTVRTTALFALSLFACDPFDMGQPFDERETQRLDTDTVIEVRLHVRPSFPDNVADARVTLLRRGQRSLAVLDDWAQVQGLRSRTRAVRLSPGGAIAVYLREKLCVLPVGAPTFACRSIAEDAPSPWSNAAGDSPFDRTFLSALEWVSGHRETFSAERTRAAVLAANAPRATNASACPALSAATDGAERENNTAALRVLDRERRARRCPAQNTP
ncbi:MAG: hypothetical protein U0269_18480 [Polyangiales bacterium]